MNEKENLIYAYKELLKEIIFIKDEIEEVDEMILILPEQSKSIGYMRKSVLESKIQEKRTSLIGLCSQGVSQFGPSIINEF